MLLVSGKPNEAVRELWRTKVRRSFKEVDGPGRVRDLLEQMPKVEVKGDKRYAVYPGRDKKVMRVVWKVIRGLCHYHRIMSPVSDRRVCAGVLGNRGFPDFLNHMEYHHCEKDIAEWRYQVLDAPPHSLGLANHLLRAAYFLRNGLYVSR